MSAMGLPSYIGQGMRRRLRRFHPIRALHRGVPDQSRFDPFLTHETFMLTKAVNHPLGVQVVDHAPMTLAKVLQWDGAWKEPQSPCAAHAARDVLRRHSFHGKVVLTRMPKGTAILKQWHVTLPKSRDGTAQSGHTVGTPASATRRLAPSPSWSPSDSSHSADSPRAVPSCAPARWALASGGEREPPPPAPQEQPLSPSLSVWPARSWPRPLPLFQPACQRFFPAHNDVHKILPHPCALLIGHLLHPVARRAQPQP